MPTPAQPPIVTAHLFPIVEKKLIELLRSLEPADWDRQTVSPKWKVRHVAAHLLDTELRRLSLVRDGFFTEKPENATAEGVKQFVNRLNEEGVRVYGRLSPKTLVLLLESVAEDFCQHMRSLDPFKPSVFAVSWAGEQESLNWFDSARELTERWHHQQQIRLATGREGIMTPELYHPVLKTFLRVLPWHYREVKAQPGAILRIVITGECGGEWQLMRAGDGWRLVSVAAPSAVAGNEAAHVEVPQEIAWRIFTKGIARAEAEAMCTLRGNAELTEKFFSTTAIVG